MLTVTPMIAPADRREENEGAFSLFQAIVGDRVDGIDSRNTASVIHIKCECSDENCARHIALSSGEYQNIRAGRDAFIVFPGHQGYGVTKVLSKKAQYSVILNDNSIR